MYLYQADAIDFEHEDGGQADNIVQIMISEQPAGYQQTGLTVDNNYHSTQSNVTFNITQENEASNTFTDGKHTVPSTKNPMSITVPSGKSNGGPSTPTV